MNGRTSLIDFSNALSEANAVDNKVSNLSLRSRTLWTQARAAFVLAPPASADFPLTSSVPVSSDPPTTATNLTPSLTDFPVSTIHLERPSWRQAWPVETRPNNRYNRWRSSMRESEMRADKPEAEWVRIARRWEVMSVFSRRVMRRNSVEGER